MKTVNPSAGNRAGKSRPRLSYSTVAAVILILFLPAVVLAKEIPVKTVDLSIPADQLPYRLRPVSSMKYGRPAGTAGYMSGDINGDGISEFFLVLSSPTGEGLFSSAVVCYPGLSDEDWLFQFNGKYSQAKIWGEIDFLDVIGQPGDEMILTKIIADTVMLEIVSFDSIFNLVDTNYVTAAIGTGLKPGSGWNFLRVETLASADANNDGISDLIFSRLAKPDSAFSRGVVAYDLHNERQVWFYPLADLTGAPNFHLVKESDNSFGFVFATNSSKNRYAANGMDSYHAYAIGLDQHGHERWRDTIGDSGYYPKLLACDVNGDGRDEACALIEGDWQPPDDDFYFNAYDALTGEVVLKSDIMPGNSFLSACKLSDEPGFANCIYVAISSEEGSKLYKLNKHLDIEAIAMGPFGAYLQGVDLNGDGEHELIAGMRDHKLAVLDRELHLMAYAETEGTTRLLRSGSMTRILIDGGTWGFDIFELQKRDFVPLFFARYKWYLAVFVAALLMAFLYRGAIWISKLYVSSAGLPSLDRIKAMVIVLNRKGKIIYLNQNPLSEALLGRDARRLQAYDKTGLTGHPHIFEMIKRSFADPYFPAQGQFEIGDGQSPKEVALVVYPRIDKNNNFLGKVIIAEDVSGKAGWQRKAVLGEAAQRWVHKLKGDLATARISIENLMEDQRLPEAFSENELMQKYITSIKGKIEETAGTADKILHFARIATPDRIKHDINRVVDAAAEPYRNSMPPGIKLTLDRQSGLPLVLIDPEQMREVLDNLISNAINAIDGDGQVNLQTRTAENLLEKGDREAVEIVVEDTGAGIADGDLDKIFSPGFSRSPGGTGIGLAIVREIVENHGGRVLAENRQGAGARFVIRLPVGE